MLIVYVFCAIPLAAQSTAGTIAGTVRAAQSTAVQGARVAAVNAAKDLDIKKVSDEFGSFTLYPVPRGAYSIAIEAAGLQPKTISGVHGNRFLIDGVSARDEMQQFKLKNSNSTAEYCGEGTQMAIVVKSGLNQIHGSSFEFDRSEVGQARRRSIAKQQLPLYGR